MKPFQFFFISFLLISHFSGHSQKTFTRSTVEIFDKYEMKLKRINSNIETFRMSLLRRIDQTAKDTTLGVNIEIETVKKSDLISSSGFTITSNLDFALSASNVQKIDHQKGTMLLSLDEFLSLFDFINESIGRVDNDLKYDSGWQLVIAERFALALIFETQGGASGKKWKYYLRLDDAEFEVTFEDALEMIGKMSSFKKRIKAGIK